MTHIPFALGAALLILSPGIAAAQGAPDQGKKACVAEARRLCPMEMKSMSRKKVEGCMIQKIEQTSPTCHAAMLRIKAEREAASPRR
ncbi:hypothetical protein SOM26_10425 [Sphingomonas sp. CFBP8993]|uniref:hypothetical protein n=1 Tax=Sphingomonas sp. CFBP8993 TaxID=3096526 RepID=UPI002A6B8F4C|nr:hypothetical protein [Sphingomonas sp. CFBP8993]MDY0959098.1 hypothetical protein [Sphingomonas sp. CFBP8993]